jgi:hypothetical protein
MAKITPTINDLFKQLGLPDSDEEIQVFINSYKPTSKTVKLYEAPFWTPAQAALLEQIIHEDGNWSYLADHLDVLLR